MKKIKEKERVANRFFPVTNSSVSHAPIACSPYNDSFVIRLASDKGADRIPGNTFDQAQVAPENSSANASAHVPYMDGVVQAPTSEH